MNDWPARTVTGVMATHSSHCKVQAAKTFFFFFNVHISSHSVMKYLERQMNMKVSVG